VPVGRSSDEGRSAEWWPNKKRIKWRMSNGWRRERNSKNRARRGGRRARNRKRRRRRRRRRMRKLDITIID
jgi:hypothetical protein